MTASHPNGTLTACLIGSFHRDPDRLSTLFTSLSASFVLLSPEGVEFVDPDADFVLLPGQDTSARDIQDEVLARIADSDFVWLHCPNGHVGSSAAFEIGYAHALGIPVFTLTAPADVTLREYVTVLPDITSAPGSIAADPARGLDALQRYSHRVAVRRDWDDETARDTLLNIVEELGELCRAVRKQLGGRRDHAYGSAKVAEEVADVQLYLAHLANILGVRIADAVRDKDAENQRRYDATHPA